MMSYPYFSVGRLYLIWSGHVRHRESNVLGCSGDLVGTMSTKHFRPSAVVANPSIEVDKKQDFISLGHLAKNLIKSLIKAILDLVLRRHCWC